MENEGQACSGLRGLYPATQEDIYFGEDDPPKTIRTCGYFTPAKVVVTETTIRDTIAQVARDEYYTWINQASDSLYREDNDKMIGKLVKYWIAADSSIPASIFALLNPAANTISYGNLPKLELDASTTNVDSARATVVTRLLASVPSAKRSSINSAVATAVHNAWRSSNNVEAWSAAFIVWCVRMGAVILGLETDAVKDVLLQGTGAHRAYILEAYKRRFGTASEKRTGCYHAYERTTIPIAGDIVAIDRQSQSVTDVLAFTDIPAKLKDGYALHCDLVVKVNAKNVETIGGNLGESATYRSYPLNPDGTLVTDVTNQFTQQCPTNLVLPLAHNNDKVVFKDNDFNTARIFALLRLEKECRDLPVPKS